MIFSTYGIVVFFWHVVDINFHRFGGLPIRVTYRIVVVVVVVVVVVRM